MGAQCSGCQSNGRQQTPNTQQRRSSRTNKQQSKKHRHQHQHQQQHNSRRRYSNIPSREGRSSLSPPMAYSQIGSQVVQPHPMAPMAPIPPPVNAIPPMDTINTHNIPPNHIISNNPQISIPTTNINPNIPNATISTQIIPPSSVTSATSATSGSSTSTVTEEESQISSNTSDTSSPGQPGESPIVMTPGNGYIPGMIPVQPTPANVYPAQQLRMWQWHQSQQQAYIQMQQAQQAQQAQQMRNRAQSLQINYAQQQKIENMQQSKSNHRRSASAFVGNNNNNNNNNCLDVLNNESKNKNKNKKDKKRRDSLHAHHLARKNSMINWSNKSVRNTIHGMEEYMDMMRDIELLEEKSKNNKLTDKEETRLMRLKIEFEKQSQLHEINDGEMEIVDEKEALEARDELFDLDHLRSAVSGSSTSSTSSSGSVSSSMSSSDSMTTTSGGYSDMDTTTAVSTDIDTDEDHDQDDDDDDDASAVSDLDKAEDFEDKNGMKWVDNPNDNENDNDNDINDDIAEVNKMIDGGAKGAKEVVVQVENGEKAGLSKGGVPQANQIKEGKQEVVLGENKINNGVLIDQKHIEINGMDRAGGELVDL